MELSELVFIDSTGYHFADYPTILEWLKGKYREIYGEDTYLEADSQDGQLLAAQAQAMYDAAAVGGSVYNAFSPATAQGTGLSKNVKINGLTRRAATHSTVDLTIVGQAGTVLNNCVAIDELDQKWDIPDGTTIPGGGSIVVTATAQEIGDIEAAADTVNRIFTPTLGWQSVNNVAEATAGIPVETDAELRGRQQVSTAIPSLTVLEGQVGAVADLTGVIRVRGYENDTDAPDIHGIPEHSVELMVLGGDTDEIAETIARKKTPGTGTFGTTSVVVTDSRGMPLTISFTRPTQAVITVRITLAAQDGWTTQTEPKIAEAVAATINAFGIGNAVLLTKLFAPAYLFGQPESETFDIATIELAKNGGAFAEANVAIDYDEYPDCDPDTDFTFVVS